MICKIGKKRSMMSFRTGWIGCRSNRIGCRRSRLGWGRGDQLQDEHDMLQVKQ
jgi:hypothetical protein